jgi:two-component system OmpR family sensor kinase
LDDGIGIDEPLQKTIFDKFERATKSGGGFGLGLYIVKTICDEYGIKIELESKKEKGSKFRLVFS